VEDYTGNRILIVSDTHICHHNIVKYCGRPTNCDGMIIRNFQRVPVPDVIIHVGDFGFFNKTADAERAYHNMIEKPGHPDPILIRGNHDKKYVVRLPWSEVVETVDQPFQFEYKGLVVAVQHRSFHDTPRRSTPGRWLRQRIADLLLRKKERKAKKHLHGYFFLSEQDPPRNVDICIHGHVHELGHRYDWIDDSLVVNSCVEHWDYKSFTMDTVVKEYHARKAYNNRRK